jgi:hypothetical protein
MGNAEQINADFGIKPSVKTLTASTATQLATDHGGGVRGILLRADFANSDAIYIGNDNTVTNLAGWTAILMPLDPTLLIPIGDASKIWLYSLGVNQKFGWSAV